MKEMFARVNGLIDAEGNLRHMAILRILLGPIVLLHLRNTFADARDGIVYSDRFYLPYADWYPEAPAALYEVMLWAAGVTAILMSIGFATRFTSAYTAFFVAYNIFLSKTHFAHNRAFLLILLVTIAVIPAGNHLSIDALIRRRLRRPEPRPTPLWPIWLVRFEVVAVYCASGLSKVIDQDWWRGRVLQLRAIDNRQLAIDEGAPAWLMDLLADGTFQWWFSKSAVLTEFVIGLGLLHRKTRLLAIWTAIPFHIAIQVGARVQVFSWAAIAALIIWVTPTDRRSELVVPSGTTLATWLPRLDWFGRFDVLPDDGQTVILTDLDGTVTRGSDAKRSALLRLPATFWFTAPSAGVEEARSGR
jgi:uncharacterized membrane protein YphA (DoxX/SURF4 family)